ncbi:MAG: C4-type zinc ribbon domain-containing protein [Bacteroidales bacterium]|nr:C4-type zinc ribbon domain-containing protein [Bacteroidales bacterium]
MAKKAANKNEEVVEQNNQNVEIKRAFDVDPIIEKRLIALYSLQLVDSKIDEIKIIKGELPEAIRDLEDEIMGLQTRVENFNNTIDESTKAINVLKEEILQHEAQIKKYEKQQENVRNNREYESLSKEIEYQNLEIQLCERKTKEANAKISDAKERIEASTLLMQNRQNDLDHKKSELDGIMSEYEEQESKLNSKSLEQEQFIEERYLTAYKRIRNAARNGLAVVPIDRDACGGCYSSIPPQRQMEIRMKKKVIVCEHCGRILVDNEIVDRAQEQVQELVK